jgi:hypothetical protein
MTRQPSVSSRGKRPATAMSSTPADAFDDDDLSDDVPIASQVCAARGARVLSRVAAVSRTLLMPRRRRRALRRRRRKQVRFGVVVQLQVWHVTALAGEWAAGGGSVNASPASYRSRDRH